MKIEEKKFRQLLGRDLSTPSPDQLLREENVFFVGGNLPERPTLETLYDSHYQSNAALFHLTFGDLDSFTNGETLARMIKKNFNTRLIARLDLPAPAHLIERAYAAGVDILDIPLTAFDGSRTDRGMAGIEMRLRSIECARYVFPRWSVISTLVAGEEAANSTVAGIDTLLAAEVLPLVTLSKSGARLSREELSGIYTHLQTGWRANKAATKPLLPLINLVTPLAPASSRGMVRGLIDIIDDRRQLAASDLRRILRVKEVEQSFESAAL
ncbi:hypothetical protein [Geomonas sp.]|uniref:hypothetical protein n=1 Tax=Geomonas sp. TaxID=2651584 RepID=UPI002B498C86|nr:hypothetical protein [Geomonas sp.]HJV33686.1 hypothetical protein [Geomonas sp.]